jgi:transposase InsO family protein
MFWRRSRALSKDTRASSPARLRLSSARRSLVCAPLTEGERTDADALCWCRDDRVFDLDEVECAILSSRSTTSLHCFMAPGEAVELGGCHNNSLAAGNAPGDALDGVRTFALPCAAMRRAQQE